MIMNRFHLLILIISTSSSFVVDSQRNFSKLLESLNTNISTTTTESPTESSSKIYPKQRSQARFEVREKYTALLAELDNSVNDEYYDEYEISGSGDDYYFDYEELSGSGEEELEFPELGRLLSNQDEFFTADGRFKSDDSIKKKRRVRRSTLPFPKHHRMDRVGYRPPHYMEGVDFTLETVFGLPMADYYVSRYGVHSPMDTMPHHRAPDVHYAVEPPSSYKEPPMVHVVKPDYVAPKPEYHEPPKPVYHQPVKPEYHAPEIKYKTPDYHEPPKLEYIVPQKTKYVVPQYHDPQLDYRSPNKPGIILPVKKKVVSDYVAEEEDYYDVTPKYQTPIYYSSKSSPFLKAKKSPPHLRPKPHRSSAQENGYAVYYLPYDQYVMEYPEYGLNPRIPTLPGNAHFLVASPHRPPSLAGKRRKRSAPLHTKGSK